MKDLGQEQSGESGVQTEQDLLGVNDADIQRIIDEGEPGVGDVMANFERYERAYFAAVGATTPHVTYRSSTSTD